MVISSSLKIVMPLHHHDSLYQKSLFFVWFFKQSVHNSFEKIQKILTSSVKEINSSSIKFVFPPL